MTVDSIFAPSARSIANRNLASLWETFGEAFNGGLFETKNVSSMMKSASIIKTELTKGNAIAPETDPKLVVIRGGKTPFKHTLYGGVLTNLKLLSADLALIILAMKDWSVDLCPKNGNDDLDALELSQVNEEIQSNAKTPVSEVFELLHSCSGIASMGADFKDLFNFTAETCTILKHATEDAVFKPATLKKMEEKAGLSELKDENKLFRELDERREQMDELRTRFDTQTVAQDCQARVAVTIRSLENAVTHLSLIGDLCLHENIY